jgi:hypothetical protein
MIKYDLTVDAAHQPAAWANPSSPSASTQTEKLGLKGPVGGAAPEWPA